MSYGHSHIRPTIGSVIDYEIILLVMSSFEI